MAIESLDIRRRKLAELRDRDGHPIDQRKLTHEKFLSSPNSGSDVVLNKSLMANEFEDRRAYLRQRNLSVAKVVRNSLAGMNFDLQKLAKRRDKLGEATRSLSEALDLLENGPAQK